MIDKSTPCNLSLLMSESSLNHQTPTHYTYSISMCDIWKLHVPDDGRLASQHQQKYILISIVILHCLHIVAV